MIRLIERLVVADVRNCHLKAVSGQILNVCARHWSIEIATPLSFFSNKDETSDFLLPLLIPHDDFDNVLIELTGCVLSRDFEFIGCMGFGIQYVDLLIQIGRDEGLNLETIWVNRIHG